ncbi:solute carrier family 35 member B1 homolog [Cylas formicarius]|uniref:solute carrier family 35 member B1 homolog n=1 Tax=Cylas formicarius TaxID=197179 RepID=UPI002958A68A|nr:solute carrier family 35 member B1 homolog [Cylas formicarius]
MNKQRFIFLAAGIFVSFLYYGVLQETVTRGKYSYETKKNDGSSHIVHEKFTFAITLVCIQCIINYVVACIAGLIWTQAEDKTAKLYYASVSVTYLLAMVASNMALQWVPYPTQAVGKSAKPIPVMILGVLLGKKSYPFKKYLFVFLIVTGIVIFMLKEGTEQISPDFEVGMGEVLLFLSLVLDGLTGAIQERIRADAKPSGIQMMRASNGWSSIYMIAVALLTNEVVIFLKFASRYPFVYYNLLAIGITSGIGQLFLYSMVSDFGPLSVSIVTTTRKFFTVLGSVLLFGNSLSSQQWMGAVLVFGGLFLDAIFSKGPSKKQDKK